MFLLETHGSFIRWWVYQNFNTHCLKSALNTHLKIQYPWTVKTLSNWSISSLKQYNKYPTSPLRKAAVSKFRGQHVFHSDNVKKVTKKVLRAIVLPRPSAILFDPSKFPSPSRPPFHLPSHSTLTLKTWSKFKCTKPVLSLELTNEL